MSIEEPNSTAWKVYIIEATDGKLYTGITTDIDKRWQSHKNGKGAKFFRGRRPKTLRYLENHTNRSNASKREAQIKKLSHKEKLALIASYSDL